MALSQVTARIENNKKFTRGYEKIPWTNVKKETARSLGTTVTHSQDTSSLLTFLFNPI